METAVQLVMNGIIAGGLYALVALGFTLIYGILKIIHFAHGEVFMFAAYIAWVLNVALGFGIFTSFIVAVLAAGLLGILIERVFYRPLRKKPAINSLIVAIGLSLLMQSLALLIFGAKIRAFSTIGVKEGISIFGAFITPIQIAVIFISLALMVLLLLFIKYTKLGKAVRAATDNLEVAAVVGIDTDKVISIIFFVGSMLAGAAGVLYGIEHSLTITMGIGIIIKAFTASIVGGVGNIRGALVGGFIIGLVENIGVWFIPSGYKDAIAFVILVIMLVFYPKGMFGSKTEEDVRE